MTEEDILNAVKSVEISGTRQIISHNKRPSTTYVVLDYIWVDIEDVWFPYVSYMDTTSNTIYARKASQFHNFTFGVGYGQF